MRQLSSQGTRLVLLQVLLLQPWLDAELTPAAELVRFTNLRSVGSWLLWVHREVDWLEEHRRTLVREVPTAVLCSNTCGR